MKLVYEASGTEVKIGDEAILSRGERVVVTEITKPHKPESTGRVTVKGRRSNDFPQSYFPSVIGAKWVEREDQEEEDRA